MKKPKPKTQIELATLLAVSRKTLGNWKREGMAVEIRNHIRHCLMQISKFANTFELIPFEED